MCEANAGLLESICYLERFKLPVLQDSLSGFALYRGEGQRNVN